MHVDKNTLLLSNKELKFTRFKGTTDSYLHVCIFSNEVSLITLDEDLYAKLFTFFLKGESSKCFSKFPHGSITNFGQLKISFCDHLQLCIVKKFTFDNFLKIRQREGQSIKKIIKFWTKKVNHIHVNDDIKIMAFLEKLQPKYVVKCFDYRKLPLDAFLWALLEKEKFNIRYGHQKPKSKQKQDKSPPQPQHQNKNKQSHETLIIAKVEQV